MKENIKYYIIFLFICLFTANTKVDALLQCYYAATYEGNDDYYMYNADQTRQDTDGKYGEIHRYLINGPTFAGSAGAYIDKDDRLINKCPTYLYVNGDDKFGLLTSKDDVEKVILDEVIRFDKPDGPSYRNSDFKYKFKNYIPSSNTLECKYNGATYESNDSFTIKVVGGRAVLKHDSNNNVSNNILYIDPALGNSFQSLSKCPDYLHVAASGSQRDGILSNKYGVYEIEENINTNKIKDFKYTFVRDDKEATKKSCAYGSNDSGSIFVTVSENEKKGYSLEYVPTNSERTTVNYYSNRIITMGIPCEDQFVCFVSAVKGINNVIIANVVRTNVWSGENKNSFYFGNEENKIKEIMQKKVNHYTEMGTSFQTVYDLPNNQITCLSQTSDVVDPIPDIPDIETCDDLMSVDLMSFVSKAFSLVKIVVPILVVILSILDFMKAVFAEKDDDMKKAQSKFIKRLIIAVVIFLIPTIINFILDVLMDNMEEACRITENVN